MKILLTGAAGFIGAATAHRLISRGDTVVGVDNLNSYYDVNLKRSRLSQLEACTNFRFADFDVVDRAAMGTLFLSEKFDRVVHLAAQAGVRNSIENPLAYIDSNLLGFANVLEGCRHNDVQHLVYASSSSVYGGNTKMPFSEQDAVDHPVSLYAATKKANELMAHSYSHIYGLPTTGLRFFTVYGPWGRPDMAPMLFTKAILEGNPINVFNHGQMFRDFTYIDDIVEGVVRTLDKPATADHGFHSAKPNASTSHAPYRVFNIGNGQPVGLLDFITCIENTLGIKAEKNFLPMQDGDVVATFASTNSLNAWVGFNPTTSIVSGIAQFVAWYRSYYGA
jgi:UDP-glucuronate 4-epimerase